MSQRKSKILNKQRKILGQRGIEDSQSKMNNEVKIFHKIIPEVRQNISSSFLFNPIRSGGGRFHHLFGIC